jgi:hypothetical protein
MPVHDWTSVAPDIFHDLHLAWVAEIGKVLNCGRLLETYYALAEQHGGRSIADILTFPARPLPVEPFALARRRSLAIRHVTGHRLVALLEILSPANKDRPESVRDFTTKVVDALDAGVHVLFVDLFPPGESDPDSMHGVICRRLEQSDERYDLPAEEPLTLASYRAGPRVEIDIEHLAVGAPLCDMPLYLRPDRYVKVPLEATYQAAYAGMPAFWRHVLEGRR